MYSRVCNYGDLCHHKHITLLWLRGGAEAKIEMKGDKNKSIVQQSAGLHLIEVNNSGDRKGNWTYAEYSVVLLVFVFILKFYIYEFIFTINNSQMHLISAVITNKTNTAVSSHGS